MVLLTNVYRFLSVNQHSSIKDVDDFVKYNKYDKVMHEFKKSTLHKWRRFIFDNVQDKSEPFEFCSCFTGVQLQKDVLLHHKYVWLHKDKHKLLDSIRYQEYSGKISGCLRIMSDYFYINETKYNTYIVWWWKSSESFLFENCFKNENFYIL